MYLQLLGVMKFIHSPTKIHISQRVLTLKEKSVSDKVDRWTLPSLTTVPIKLGSEGNIKFYSMVTGILNQSPPIKY